MLENWSNNVGAKLKRIYLLGKESRAKAINHDDHNRLVLPQRVMRNNLRRINIKTVDESPWNSFDLISTIGAGYTQASLCHTRARKLKCLFRATSKVFKVVRKSDGCTMAMTQISINGPRHKKLLEFLMSLMDKATTEKQEHLLIPSKLLHNDQTIWVCWR